MRAQDFVRACQARGLDVRLMDGEGLTFDQEFDAVFSNAALHWMTRPERVIAGVWRALKPQGRFVAEFGGHGNVAAITTALHAMARAPRQGRRPGPSLVLPVARGLSRAAGGARFRRARASRSSRARRRSRPAWPPGSSSFNTPFFAQFGADFDAAVKQAEELLEFALCDAQGNWTADYVRLRVEARKP